MANMKKMGTNVPILQVKKLKLRETEILVQGSRMPRASCPQSLPSFCSEGVVRLAPTDQRLPECLSNVADHRWAPPLASLVLGTGNPG